MHHLPISRVSVLGAGQMGTGIAIVSAKAACKVVLADAYVPSLEKSKQFVHSWAEKEVTKGRLQDKDRFLERLQWVNISDPRAFEGQELVIEAVPEVFDLKANLLKHADEAAPKSAIIATNTSSISITKLAAVTQRPEQVIGLHFMNPVPVMTLVEVIKGLTTSDSVLERSIGFCKQIGKDPAVAVDRPGFVANRLLMPYLNEAIFALQEGVATREDIDKIMKLGTNVPMGPLALADFIGLDTCLSTIRVLHDQFGDSKYRPATLLIQMVDSGRLGRKVGRGFYDY